MAKNEGIETAWSGVPNGWRQLYGDFDRLGLSVEWHEFRTEEALDWGRSFRPQSVEFCLNMDGRGAVGTKSSTRRDYTSGTSGYYSLGDEPLLATRDANDRHRFVTLEFSRKHLQKQLQNCEGDLDPQMRAAVFPRKGKRRHISAAAHVCRTARCCCHPRATAGAESGADSVVSKQGA